MVQNLFRGEAVEARSISLEGDVILQQSVALRAATWAIAALVLLSAGLVVAGKYARVETARGILVPVGGAAKLYPLHPGLVTKILVRDGDRVRAGQTLALVRVETPDVEGKAGAEKQLGSLETQESLAGTQVDLAGRRSAGEVARLTDAIAGLHQQSEWLDEQIRLQQTMVESTTRTFNEVSPVVARGFISKSEFERRRQQMLSAQEELSRVRQQSDANRAQLAQAERERAKAILDGRSEQANARSAIETLRQQHVRVSGDANYAVVAPVSGRVTAIQASVGSVLTGQLPMMVVLPEDSKLRADIFVPTRAIGFIREGQEVRLLYDAFPYQRFGGYAAHVETISRLAVAGTETDAPFKIEEPVYRITATLDRQQVTAYGKSTSLQPGMTLFANIILDRQSFLDWLLEPLRAVSNRT